MYPYYSECQMNPSWVLARQMVVSGFSEVGGNGFSQSDNSEIIYEATTSSIRILNISSMAVQSTISQSTAVQTLTAAKGGVYLAAALGSKYQIYILERLNSICCFRIQMILIELIENYKTLPFC